MRRLLDEDLTKRLPRVEPKPAKTVREFTRQELAAILRVMRRQWNGRLRTKVLRFSLWTGCRNGQARALAWDGLDLEAGTATLIRQKPSQRDRGKPHVIPLTPRLVRMLGSITRNGSVFAITWTYNPAPLAHDLTALRFELLKKGHDISAFHAGPQEQKIRNEVVTILRRHTDWQFAALVVEKAKVFPSLRDEPRFYGRFATMLMNFVLRGRVVEQFSPRLRGDTGQG